MLFSKANLLVHGAVSGDKYDRGLTGVRFESDGSTVGGNGRVLVAVGPADPSRVTFPDIAGDQMEPGGEGMVLPVELVRKTIKGLSTDKRLSLQHAAMTRVKDPGRVGFTVLDPAGNPTTTAALPMREQYPEWKQHVRRVAGSGEEGTTRVCVNRKNLLEMLKVLEAACPDKGGVSPVFLEIGRQGTGVVARTVNYLTGQHVVGACAAYKTGGKWLERDVWERGVFGGGKRKRKINLRRRTGR